jgi:hypothetical protein
MQSPNKIVVFLLLLVLLLMSRASFGQTNNTFPSTGNAGIGTRIPANALEIMDNGVYELQVYYIINDKISNM